MNGLSRAELKAIASQIGLLTADVLMIREQVSRQVTRLDTVCGSLRTLTEELGRKLKESPRPGKR